jgi:hypothetical protein
MPRVGSGEVDCSTVARHVAADQGDGLGEQVEVEASERAVCPAVPTTSAGGRYPVLHHGVHSDGRANQLAAGGGEQLRASTGDVLAHRRKPRLQHRRENLGHSFFRGAGAVHCDEVPCEPLQPAAAVVTAVVTAAAAVAVGAGRNELHVAQPAAAAVLVVVRPRVQHLAQELEW